MTETKYSNKTAKIRATHKQELHRRLIIVNVSEQLLITLSLRVGKKYARKSFLLRQMSNIFISLMKVLEIPKTISRKNELYSTLYEQRQSIKSLMQLIAW